MSGRTIGVTLPIPQPHRFDLDRLRATWSPDPPQMPAHVTVLAPVDVDEDVVPNVLAHLAYVAARTAPFDLTLAGSGTFRPISPVVYVTVADGARECAELEAQVRSGALGVEARFPYHPHVTIAQDLDDDELDQARSAAAGIDARMRIDAMNLHEYRAGAWHLLRAFGFGGVPA